MALTLFPMLVAGILAPGVAIALVGSAIENTRYAALQAAAQERGALVLEADLNRYVLAQKEYLLRGDAESLEAVAQQETRLNQDLRELRGRQRTVADKELLDKLESDLALLRMTWPEAVERRRLDGPEAAANVVRGRERPVEEAAASLAGTNARQAEESLRRVEQAVDEARIWLPLLGLLALVSGSVLAWLTVRSITRPLPPLLAVSEAVAAGDLTIEPPPLSSVAELARLGESQRHMVLELRSIVTSLRDEATRISTSAAELSAVSQQDAGSAVQQATAVAQSTATMEELARTAEQIAELASRALQAAEVGREAAEASAAAVALSRERVTDLAREISELAARAHQIGGLADIIGEIAGRTHLLAINAAIESASAGENGRRFAIIAGQVKELADSSKAETVRVKALLSEMQAATERAVLATEAASREAEEGQGRAAHAAGSIATIVQSAQTIAMATQQQRSAAEQAVEAMVQLSGVAEQQADMGRQLAEAAGELDGAASTLQALTGRFRLATPTPDKPPAKPWDDQE